MHIINFIKNRCNTGIVSCCSEKGCKLNLNGLSNYVILKGEMICSNRKICDCIIFIRNNCIIIGIVELKSRNIHTSEIVEKLTNGSEIALNILEESNDKSMKFDFYHLILYKGINTAEFKVIKSKKIEIKGKKYDIIPKRCGVSFSAVISTFEQ